MFGVSFSEFLVVLVLFLVVTDPKDIPHIVRYVAKAFFKVKNMFNLAKDEVSKISKELGLEDMKNELEEQVKKESQELKKTTIIDLYGNVHEVHDVAKIRGDLAKEDLAAEIEKYNFINQNQAKKVEDSTPEIAKETTKIENKNSLKND